MPDGKKSDFFALGILMYKLLFNHLPFADEINETREIYNQILSKPLEIPQFTHSGEQVTPELSDFLQQIC